MLACRAVTILRWAARSRLLLAGSRLVCRTPRRAGMIARDSVILIDQVEREREKARARSVGCGCRGYSAPVSPDPADRRRGDPRRPIVNQFLGSDGLRDHGRLGGRDASETDLPAGALRDVVPGQSAGGRKISVSSTANRAQ